MISFLNNWIEQIAISVIIVSIFELILPSGNLKKYIKVVLGIYIIFCMISPFTNGFNLYDIKDINFNEYIENLSTEEKNVNQESMNLRIKNLYEEEIKKDLSKKIEEEGYRVYKCNIETNLNQNAIDKLNLVLTKSSVEKIEIGSEKDENNEEIEKIKNKIASEYEIDKNLINIKIK